MQLTVQVWGDGSVAPLQVETIVGGPAIGGVPNSESGSVDARSPFVFLSGSHGITRSPFAII
jgi:hypothetical protein